MLDKIKARNQVLDEVARMKRLSTLAAIFTSLSAILASQLFPSQVFFPSFYDAGALSGFLFFVILLLFLALRFFSTKVFKSLAEREQYYQITESSLLAIKQLRILLDTIGDGVLATDEDGRILLANRMATDILGKSLAEILGKKISTVLKLSLKGKTYDFISILTDRKKEKVSLSQRDLKLQTYQKGEIDTFFYGAPIFHNSKFSGIITIFRDLSEENALRKRKEEFVALTSHELRTPLTVIEGYLYPVLKKRKITSVERNYLSKAYKACRDLTNLVTQLLIISKEQNKEIEIYKEKFELDELLGSIIFEYQNEAKQKNVKLIFNNKTSKNFKIITDKILFTEIFHNLIKNAIKFTEGGFVKISTIKDGKNLVVEVEDNGGGIPEKEKQNIFTQFYQIESWKTREKGGVGLGLYIVKLFVKRLNGKIKLESKVGEGSRFIVNLPID